MKRLLLIATSFTFGLSTIGQTTLFTENFETGGASMTLNTATLGGQVGLAGDNAWVVNNTFTGGSGTSSCFGFGFTIGSTPAQPGGISPANSNYMHILSDDGSNNGIFNANYSAADGSFCFFAQSHFAQMTNSISTVGYTGVAFDFWWACVGDVNAFGQVYYSLDGGSTWTLHTSPISNYFGNNSWVNQILTNAAWDNQASVRFGFRFVNNVATAGGDPSFSIDDIAITGISGSNTITTTNDFTPASWCFGTTTAGTINFVSTGTYTAGNVYTAQLSNSAGSFASPTSIGTLSSTASGSLSIPVVITGATPAGSGYRIRVVSSNPAVTGSDNGSDIVINSLPVVTQSSFTDVCLNGAAVTLSGGSPAGGSYSGTGVSGGTFNPATAGVGNHAITYFYTDGNGCSASAGAPITVNALPAVSFTALPNRCVSEAPFTLTGGSPAGGTYSGPGVSGGTFSPTVAGIGTHTITYTVTDGATTCTNSTTQTQLVDGCAGIEDLSSASVVLYPNPAESTFVLQSEFTVDQVTLLDINGRVVKVFGNQNSYEVAELTAGMYMVHITSGDSNVIKRLIIK